MGTAQAVLMALAFFGGFCPPEMSPGLGSGPNR
jgi:hypothetical protein